MLFKPLDWSFDPLPIDTTLSTSFVGNVLVLSWCFDVTDIKLLLYEGKKHYRSTRSNGLQLTESIIIILSYQTPINTKNDTSKSAYLHQAPTGHI